MVLFIAAGGELHGRCNRNCNKPARLLGAGGLGERELQDFPGAAAVDLELCYLATDHFPLERGVALEYLGRRLVPVPPDKDLEVP